MYFLCQGKLISAAMKMRSALRVQRVSLVSQVNLIFQLTYTN